MTRRLHQRPNPASPTPPAESVACGPAGLSLRVDDPVFCNALTSFGAAIVIFSRLLHSPWSVLALGCLLLLLGVTQSRWEHRVKVSRNGPSLRVRGWWRRMTLNASNVLEVRKTPQVLDILMSDGRLLKLSGASTSALGELANGFWQGPSRGLVFRLRGIPARGRVLRLVSRVLPVSLWLRPRLSVTDECIVLSMPFWTRRIPLARIVRLRVLGHGIEIGLADSSTLELNTFAGLSLRWCGRIYDYNQLLCSFLEAARARALTRFLAGYRGTRGGFAASAASSG